MDEVYGPPWRPRARFDRIEFRDGTHLDLGSHEVVVIVGANNAGKSLMLREMHTSFANTSAARLISQSSVVANVATIENIEHWAARMFRPVANGAVRLAYRTLGGMGVADASGLLGEWVGAKDRRGVGRLINDFSTYLLTDNRLSLANSVQTIDFLAEAPANPLQLLHEDDELETFISSVFRQAFRQELIVNRGAGRNISLHIGKRPQPPPGKDRISREYRQAVNSLPLLEQQGDGMRAFTGVMLETLLRDRDLILIDEPEAFLHPPQAYLLGRLLATKLSAPRQLIVATHSSDFLRGVLDVPDSPVRVVRVSRDGDANSITELKPDDVRDIWRDPLLRYSRVLEGLFHDGVIVCEADGDCRFYSAMMEATVSPELRPDLMFVHTGGKSRLPTVIDALAAVGVPVRVVADFDLLAQESDVKRICEALGGDWTRLRTDWNTVRAAIEGQRPQVPARQAEDNIKAIFSGVSGDSLSRNEIDRIRKVLKGASAWSEAKRMGKAFIPAGQAMQAYERLVTEFKRMGLNLVEVGELEQFCKSVGNHGPEWVNQVLAKDLAKDRELGDARAFVAELAHGWR